MVIDFFFKTIYYIFQINTIGIRAQHRPQIRPWAQFNIRVITQPTSLYSPTLYQRDLEHNTCPQITNNKIRIIIKHFLKNICSHIFITSCLTYQKTIINYRSSFIVES